MSTRVDTLYVCACNFLSSHEINQLLSRDLASLFVYSLDASGYDTCLLCHVFLINSLASLAVVTHSHASLCSKSLS